MGIVPSAPSVAIVIPTFNRSELLERTLEAVTRLEYQGKVETVVVDDGSAQPHALRNEQLASDAGVRYVRQSNAGPARARNTGVASTRSEIVAFLDDDCAPLPDWLDRLAAVFTRADRGLGGVGGRVLPDEPHNWVSAFCAAAQYSSGEQPEFTNAATANAAFRRFVLEEVGGFDEGFLHPGGDDPDLSRRVREAGYELRYVPEAVVRHAEIDSVASFFKHVFHRGLGEARGKLKEGRAGHVLLRAALFPAFCARRAAQTWQVSRRVAPNRQRALYSAFEAVGAAVFVWGSLVGIARAAMGSRN